MRKFERRFFRNLLQEASGIRKKRTETMCTIQDIVYFFAILFTKHHIWFVEDAGIFRSREIFYARRADRGLSGVNLYAI